MNDTDMAVLSGLGSFLAFIAICVTMWRIGELKRIQEKSGETLDEIKHGLDLIVSILSRNDTTAPPKPENEKEKTYKL